MNFHSNQLLTGFVLCLQGYYVVIVFPRLLSSYGISMVTKQLQVPEEYIFFY